MAERGCFEFAEQAADKIRFHLSEFVPATRATFLGELPSRIRVIAEGNRAEMAPALLARVEDLAGRTLRVEVLD